MIEKIGIGALGVILLAVMANVSAATEFMETAWTDTSISMESTVWSEVVEKESASPPNITEIYTSNWGDPWIVKPKTHFKPCEKIQFNVYVKIYNDSWTTCINPMVFRDGKLVYGDLWKPTWCKAGYWVFYLKTFVPCNAPTGNYSWAALIATKDGQDCECNAKFTIT